MTQAGSAGICYGVGVRCVPFGNGLILGYLMFKSGLVPRPWTWFGLIGGPILLIANIGTLVDWSGADNALWGLLVAPEFIWEAFLGIYCAIWGFRRDSSIFQAGDSSILEPPRDRESNRTEAYGG